MVAEHISAQQHAKYEEMFNRMSGRVQAMNGVEIRAALQEENVSLDTATFTMLWNFVNIEKQEQLDKKLFAVFMHLVDHWRHGTSITANI